MRPTLLLSPVPPRRSTSPNSWSIRPAASLRGRGGIDANQVVAYDVAHAAAAVATARSSLQYGERGDVEAAIAAAFVADVVADLAGKVAGREALWGVEAGWAAPAAVFLESHRDPAVLAAARGPRGPAASGRGLRARARNLPPLCRGQGAPTRRARPPDQRGHPEEVIEGLAELGGFGLSVPEEYGGFATGGESDYMGMVVATEELSWGSLGVGGSLITRPEILTRALVYGGTEEQKKQWLPKLASAEILAAVAVTEPDYGSDVAGIVTAATAVEGGWVINGVKTWCTFAARADVLMLLARTDPDRSLAHRGISMFVVEKPRGDGHGFVLTQGATDVPGDRPTWHRAGSRVGPSTRSAIGACTRTSWRSRTGSCRKGTSSVGPRGSAKGSTSRCRDSRTGACRRRRVPWA